MTSDCCEIAATGVPVGFTDTNCQLQSLLASVACNDHIDNFATRQIEQRSFEICAVQDRDSSDCDE